MKRTTVSWILPALCDHSAVTRRPSRFRSVPRSLASCHEVSTCPRDDPATDPPWDRLFLVDPHCLCLKSLLRRVLYPKDSFGRAWNITCAKYGSDSSASSGLVIFSLVNGEQDTLKNEGFRIRGE